MTFMTLGTYTIKSTLKVFNNLQNYNLGTY